MSKFIEVEHPGILLKEDFLDDLGIKPGAFAKAIGVDRTAIKNIIDGKRSITAEMSMRFGVFFGMSAGCWLTLQRHYDLAMVHERFAEFEKTITPYEKVHA